MSYFLARVELYEADSSDYEVLHEGMEQTGFSRLIARHDGRVYHLPPAEYYIAGNFTIEQVRDAATAAAQATDLRSAVVVCECAQICWTGLQIAEPSSV